MPDIFPFKRSFLLLFGKSLAGRKRSKTEGKEKNQMTSRDTEGLE